MIPSGAGPESAPSSPDASLPTSPGHFPDWLSYRATAVPHRVALVAEDATWTYAELEADVENLARSLATLGVRADDRIASLLPNGSAPVLLVHAALRLGATLVPLNTRLRATELAWQIADSAPRMLVVDRRTTDLATSACRDTSIVIVEVMGGNPGETTLRSGTPAAPAHPTGLANAPRLVHRADDVLAIIYTSGTTGAPKGAQLTVGNFWWSAIGSALNLGIRPDDRWLAVLPLFHVGGLSIILRSAIQGTALVVHEAFDAEAVNRAIDEQGVTIVSAVGVMLQRMLDARGDRAYPASLRCVLLGGGPAPLPLLERCAALGVPVAQTYGLTEACSQVTTLSPEDAVRKIGSAGRPLYPNAVRISRADGGAAAPGEPGEIHVRGPIVMVGYSGRSGATADTIVDGWLHTGDIGRIDDDGYLHVLDRRDDLIITGGENVYPAEVESVLLAHPSVTEAGVIGVPDDTWGQRVVAVVTLEDDAPTTGTAVTLQEHCRARLAGYKVPREIRIASEALPRTASGKLQRSMLRQAVLDRPATPG